MTSDIAPQTAFVLSGGGSLGAVEVGMLLALSERGIVPDLIVGTSVGAINAAWVAGRPGPDGVKELADVWRSVRRQDAFPLNPRLGWQGLLGRRDYLVPPDNLRRLPAQHLNYERLEDAPIAIRAIATDMTNGEEVVLSRGPALDAIMASAAIPAVFPPVTIDGLHLVDGGIANNTPISYAVDAGARTIYILPTGYACSLNRPPKGALAMALHAVTLLVHQRLRQDVERYQDVADLRVAPPLCPLDVSPVDFSHTVELIERAHASTARWLAEGRTRDDPAAAMQLHAH
jgi:NTE family protein